MSNWVGRRLVIGSLWNRWDPHIHAPGTVPNDQYRGEDGVMAEDVLNPTLKAEFCGFPGIGLFAHATA
jgi:hypothetical protein